MRSPVSTSGGEPGGSAHARRAPPNVPLDAKMHSNASAISSPAPCDGIVTKASRRRVVRVFIESLGTIHPAPSSHDVSHGWTVGDASKKLRGGVYLCGC